jgi:hypothetical protein
MSIEKVIDAPMIGGVGVGGAGGFGGSGGGGASGVDDVQIASAPIACEPNAMNKSPLMPQDLPQLFRAIQYPPFFTLASFTHPKIEIA